MMFAGDLHKRSKDITTIEGYVECTNRVQHALMEDIKSLGVDCFVSLGDWYDRGYAVDVAASLADYDIDIEMSRLLGGRFYGLIGNHIRLNMDSNPELHIIQPHPVYKSRRPVIRKEQIMKTPTVLRVDDVQISFLHHRKDAAGALDYRAARAEWAKYHIALFHTPYIVPASRLADTDYGYSTSHTSKISQALEGVDLAIVGDIHNPLGSFVVPNVTGNTTMIVPGSLTNTDASVRNRHSMIMIPVLDIQGGTVSVSYHNFDLQVNRLTFKQKNVEASKERLKTLRGKSVQDLHDPRDIAAVLGSPESIYLSLNAFMQAQGYSDVDRRLVQHVLDRPEDIEELVNIYKSVEPEM